MPLAAPAPRKALHQRNISMQGFLRDDGLWDIEGHLTDAKTLPFNDHYGMPHPAGAFIHDMWLRLTVDDERVVRGVEVAMDATPFPSCVEVQSSLDALVGEQIGNGWRQVIRTKVERLRTCTHIAELLIPMASTVFQTLSLGKHTGYEQGRAQATPDARPFFIDGCHTWRADGPIVEQLYPQFAVRRAERP